MTFPFLALLVGVPLVCGVLAGLFERRAAQLVTLVAMGSLATGALLVRPDVPLTIAGAELSLSAIGRLELVFVAGVGALLIAYLSLADVDFPLLPLLPPLFAAVAAGRVFGGQLLVAAAFLQLAALLASLVMIGERREWQASVAGAAYLVLSALGGMALLFGFVLADLQRLSPGGLVTVPFVVAVLGVGFALLLGVAPLYFWLPGATLRAGTAAVVLAAGVLGPATLGLLLQALSARPQLVMDERGNGLFATAAVAVAWFGAVAALAPGKLRRVLGYVLVSDIALVVVGVATQTRIGATGAVVHLAQRSLVTLVLLGASTELERDDRGATDGACPAPYMWLTLLLGSLTLLGVPPLSGFAANWAVYQAVALVDWRLSIALAGAALVALCGVLSALGRLRREYPRPWRPPRPAEGYLMVLALAVALWGLVPGPILGAVHSAVSQLPFLKPF